LITDIRIDNPTQTDFIKANQDEFKKSYEELITLGGLSQNFKRSAKRRMEKAATSVISPFPNSTSATTQYDKYGRPVIADDNELSGDGAGSKQIILLRAGYGLFDAVEPPYDLYQLAKIYEISAPNYAAINAKAANIVGLGYDLKPTLKVKQRLEEIDNYDILDRARRKLQRQKEEVLEWLETRNDDDTLTATLMKVFIDAEATGNGYIEIGRKVTGEIGYIGHIPASTIRVRRLRDGFVQIVQGRAVFFRNFQGTEKNPFGPDPRPNEIIHIKNYTPTNTYYGIPAIVAAQAAMAGNEFAGKFNLDYFENKAVPRYIFWLKGAKMSPAAEQRLFEFFQGNLKGTNHRTVLIPLPADTETQKVDMKMEPIEAKIQDSSFKEYKRMNIQEILMAHRMPASKIGSSESVGLAAAREFDRTFKEQVCRPAQDSLEKKINKIIAEKTDSFKLEFNELTLTDEETQSKIDERYLRMKVIVPNEVRSRLNLSSLKDGDTPVQLTGQQAAEATAQATGNRTRDQQRQSNSSDSSELPRNPQGEGRQQQ
jgi:PBSX family phage portal protein